MKISKATMKCQVVIESVINFKAYTFDERDLPQNLYFMKYRYIDAILQIFVRCILRQCAKKLMKCENNMLNKCYAIVVVRDKYDYCAIRVF